MTETEKTVDTSKTNGAIDIAKLIMAVLVIGIHTEPFGFSFLLDKCFGICTRQCVPFFFVTSAYFFWQKKKSIWPFLSRVTSLYVIWSIIYLPFDIPKFRRMTLSQILRLFLWDGNEHGLWYLWGTVIGFGFVYILLKFFKPKVVLMIAVGLLIIGTVKSTYASAVFQIFGVHLTDGLGSRNGLFYAPAYIAMGMMIAKTDVKSIFGDKKKLYKGLIISLLLLAAESFLFVIGFRTESTILWLSVFPCTYFLFEIVLNTNTTLERKQSLIFRKVSTLLYVSQFLFIHPLSKVTMHFPLFLLTVSIATVFSFVVIELSSKKGLHFLLYFY